MSRLKLSERVRIAAVQADRFRRSAATRVLGSTLLNWRLGFGAGSALAFVPQSLRTADASFWPEVADGQFGLAGAVAYVDGQSPFEVDPPSEAWACALHGFDWLRHLESTGDGEAQVAARGFVLDWLGDNRSPAGLAARPAVRARRIVSWISAAPFLLDGADDATFEAFARGLSREVAFLSGSWRTAGEGYDRLLALTALVVARLASEGDERQLGLVLARLDAAIERQILPDGGHVSRNPAVLVELLLDWLPLRSCFDARRQAPPQTLLTAIERMLAMLRFLRLGDGGIARFNGNGIGDPAGLATLLAYNDAAAAPTRLASNSRYGRLAVGDVIVIADVGSPPPLQLSGDAHAGCLSIEVSAGTALLFVNAGAPGPADQAWRSVSRATSSHSTVAVGDLSSSRLVRHAGLEAMVGAVPLHLPAHVTADVACLEGAARLEASHDGYYDRLGLIHHRTVRVAPLGMEITGTDKLETKGGSDRLRRDVPFAIHFHLHPETAIELCDVAATAASESRALLRLANGQRWMFAASGARLGIEESTFFAGGSGPRSSQQIVLRGASGGTSDVAWSAIRVDSTNGAAGLDPNQRG